MQHILHIVHVPMDINTSYIGGQSCPNLSQTIQTIQTKFWVKISTFKTHSGNSIGIKSIICRDMCKQEFARFCHTAELWVTTSGVQKVWTGPTGLKLVLHARDLDQILTVLFLMEASIYECLYCVNDIWCIDLLSE